MFLDRIVQKSRRSDLSDYFRSHIQRTEASGWTRNIEGQQLLRLMMASPYVGICSQKNASVCGQCQIRLYRPASGVAMKNGRSLNRRNAPWLFTKSIVGKAADYASFAGEVEEVEDHPALALLDNPNPWMSGLESDVMRFRAQEVTGNAYYLIIRESQNAPPTELVPLFSQYVTPIGSRDGTEPLEGYVYSRSLEPEHTFTPDQILHFRFGPSLDDPYLGDGPLHNITSTVELQGAANTVEYARFRNGGRPDLWMHLVGANDEQRKAFVAKFQSEHVGPNQAGKMFVTASKEGSVQSFPLNTTNRDMEYSTLQDRADRIIWNAFDVPEAVLNMNDANRASSVVGNDQYGRLGIQPRLNRDAGAWTQMLLPLYGVVPGDMWFAYDAVVQGDEDADANRTRADVAGGIITINEARASRNMDPIEDEYADRLLINGTPIGEAPAQTGISIPGLFQSVPALPSPAVTVEASVSKSIAWNPGDIFKAKDPVGVLLPEVEKEILANFQRDLVRVLGAVNARALVERLGADASLADLQRELDKVLSEHIDIATQAGVEYVLSEVPIDDPDRFRRVKPVQALQYLEEYRVTLAEEISANLEAKIRGAVAQGIEDGQPVDAIAREIGRQWDEATPYTAERIARTETQQAFGHGRITGYEKAGIEGKVWKLAPGQCPICRAIFDGVGIDKPAKEPHALFEPFVKAGTTISVGGRTHTFKRTVQTAPLHPNCRCSIGPVLPGD